MEKRNEIPYLPHTPDYSVILNRNTAMDADCSGNFSESITEQLVNSPNIYAMSYGDELIRGNGFGLLDKLKRIKPQISSVSGGYLQLLISGLHIVLAVWWLDFMNPFGKDSKFTFMLLSYNVLAIIGGVIAGFLINRWRKQTIYYLSGSIMVISSLVLIIWSRDAVGVLFSRAIAGLGHGIVYNVVVIHAGENARKETRGIVTSTINSVIWSSVFVGSCVIGIIQMNTTVTINFDRIFGILSLAFSIIAIICTKYWTEESVVHLLSNGKLGEALELHTKLRNGHTGIETDDFEEIRLMVSLDKEENKNIFSDNNGRPLLLMVALKILSVLCNNFILYWILIWHSLGLVGTKYILMSPVILSGCRLLGSVVQTLLADSFKRRFFLLMVTLCGIGFWSLQFLLIFGGLEPHSRLIIAITFTLTTTLQFFIGCGIDPMHHNLLSEVFATSKKNWSVVFVTTWENAVELLLLGLCFTEIHIVLGVYLSYMFIPGVYISVLVIILYFTLPETRGLSLSETKFLARNMTFRCCCMKRCTCTQRER